MAAVSLSPSPAAVPFAATMPSSMSARRVPLASNPNAANSPLRGAGAGSAASTAFAKQRRSHASLQREDSYGQPPPAKKLMVERVDNLGVSSVSTSSIAQGSTTRRAHQQVHRASTTASVGTATTVSARVYPTDGFQQQQQAQHVQQVQQVQHHQHTVSQKVSEKEAEEVRRWQQSQRLRFPKLVFYFDSLPEDQSTRLAKQVMYLGAREDKFFSIDITHVVTTRAIPPEDKPLTKQQQQQQHALQKETNTDRALEAGHEHVQTINPSLLSRHHVNDLGLSTTSLPVKRKLFDTAPGRRMPLAPFGAAEDAIRKPKPARSMDVLHRAREMGKKIWSLEKLQRVLDMLLEPDPYRSAELGQRIRNGTGAVGSGMAGTSQSAASRLSGNHALLRMLDKERQTGPSDRDPTVATRELVYFKGPYLYVYDIEEKQRPIMVREYTKVADKEEGDWPQLRPSAGTRCPFIEDTDQIELRAEKKKARMRSAAAAKAAAVAGAGTTREASAASAGTSTFAQKVLASRFGAAAAATASRPATGKRTLAEMEDGHNRRVVSIARATALRPAEKGSFDSTTAAAAASAGSVSSVASAVPPTKSMHGTSASTDFQVQNAFTSRAKSARCFAGEPVASGLQAAGITSAIRSQMISSATGTLGARAGTSKEIHGLQRKVLQKSTTATSQQDLSSRRMTESGIEQQQQRPGYSRSTSLGRSTAAVTTAQQSAKVAAAVGAGASAEEKHKRTMSAPVAAQPQRVRKRDPKPGYCENCQDKFDDFDDHIVSHKHRKFAEDGRNWTELDALLGQLTRQVKYADDWSGSD